jgi:hypothetical protein
MKIDDKIKQAGVIVSTASAIYAVTVGVDGKPLKEKLKPAKVRILGIPVFERDSQLNRWWFGCIPRGKSKVAKAKLERDERK